VNRALAIRTALRPGDLGAIVAMHGLLYAKEYGFDGTFEAYVAGPLAEFAHRNDPRERIGIAEEGERLCGVIGIVAAEAGAARLYRTAGFRLVDERPGRHWGVDVLEETYELRLRS